MLFSIQYTVLSEPFAFGHDETDQFLSVRRVRSPSDRPDAPAHSCHARGDHRELALSPCLKVAGLFFVFFVCISLMTDGPLTCYQ